VSLALRAGTPQGGIYRNFREWFVNGPEHFQPPHSRKEAQKAKNTGILSKNIGYSSTETALIQKSRLENPFVKDRALVKHRDVQSSFSP
jgi:hypothetical protein